MTSGNVPSTFGDVHCHYMLGSGEDDGHAGLRVRALLAGFGEAHVEPVRGWRPRDAHRTGFAHGGMVSHVWWNVKIGGQGVFGCCRGGVVA